MTSTKTSLTSCLKIFSYQGCLRKNNIGSELCTQGAEQYAENKWKELNFENQIKEKTKERKKC